MTKQLEQFISINYHIGQKFYSHEIYNHFKVLGYSQSQISSGLNNLKKKHILANRPTQGLGQGFNTSTGKNSYKQWTRLK